MPGNLTVKITDSLPHLCQFGQHFGGLVCLRPIKSQNRGGFEQYLDFFALGFAKSQSCPALKCDVFFDPISVVQLIGLRRQSRDNYPPVLDGVLVSSKGDASSKRLNPVLAPRLQGFGQFPGEEGPPIDPARVDLNHGGTGIQLFARSFG